MNEIGAATSRRLNTLSLTLIVSLCYFLLGYVGLLLAIPPGYATVVWPASGVAVAAIILYGNRLGIGVFVGSFSINLITSLTAQSEVLDSIILCLLIALGALFQALVAGYLINKYVDLRKGLINTEDILKFFVIGGPASCIVSASVGVSALYMFGLINLEQYLFNWFTWWSGDSLGVLIVAPLALIYLAPVKRVWLTRRKKVTLPVIASLIAVVLAFNVTLESEAEYIKLEFAKIAKIVAEKLEKNIIKDSEVLYSLQTVIETSPEIFPTHFNHYAQRALSRNSGIHALSWNPMVKPDGKADFIELARRFISPQFNIKGFNETGDVVNNHKNDYYFVVSFIEPLFGNEKAVGFDIASNANRRHAINKSISLRKIVATSPIDLVQEEEQQKGILFLLPVFNSTKFEPTESSVKGVVVGVIRATSLLEDALKGTSVVNLNIELTDVTNDKLAEQLASVTINQQGEFAPFIKDTSVKPDLFWSYKINYGHRIWQLKITPTPEYYLGNFYWVAWSILIIGLLLTVILSAFLFIISGQLMLNKEKAFKLEQEVDYRKKIEHQLSLSNRRLEILSKTDTLTQIHNRRSLEEIGKVFDAETNRHTLVYSVMMLDLDHFKQVNDQWGHDVGDSVLIELSETIKSLLRKNDVFGRWGGEEFLIVVKHSIEESPNEIAQKICISTRKHNFPKVGNITVSIGIATKRKNESFTEIVKAADNALYYAKTHGRDRVETQKAR